MWQERMSEGKRELVARGRLDHFGLVGHGEAFAFYF